ncbi:MAG: type VI secretion system baseplate subunit TssK [Gemmatimonadaceae bacterium]|nr:type VI secretion system baseplate subunit TssK [Gemmatimonadaceae bacterium]
MPHAHSVLWSKGTLLAPQHLQQQDRAHEESLAFQVAALSFCPWGLQRVDLDRAALAAGNVVVTAVVARFPDGLVVDAPAGDPSPAPRPFGAIWGPDATTLIVYLAVPEYRPGGRNVASASERAIARWHGDEVSRRDEVTGLGERPISVARANLRLLFEGESLDGYTTLPVLRLVRDAAGVTTIDPSYVPPLLELGANEYLVSIARRLLERVASKASAVSGARRQRNQGLADFSVTDVAAFWLLYTLNTHLPALRHLHEVRRGHPAGLWEAMIALAGALTTFSAAPTPLPTYDHLRLGDVFTLLDARVHELLDTAVPDTAVARPLRVVRHSVHAVAVEQQSWLQAPQWYLAVAASLRPVDIVNKVVSGCKVASSDVVDTLIRQALAGVELVHVAQPPAGLPIKMDQQYFVLRRTGPAWEAIERARNLAVWVPSDLGDARLELIVQLR